MGLGRPTSPNNLKNSFEDSIFQGGFEDAIDFQFSDSNFMFVASRKVSSRLEVFRI